MTKLLAQNVGDISTWGLPTTKLPSDLPGISTMVLEWLLGFMGMVAVAAVLYSGIMYITSNGETDQAEKAKKNLTWAITGIVIITLALFLVQFTQTVLKNAAP